MYCNICKYSLSNIFHKANLYSFHSRKDQAMNDDDLPNYLNFSIWLQNKENEKTVFTYFILHRTFSMQIVHYYFYQEKFKIKCMDSCFW